MYWKQLARARSVHSYCSPLPTKCTDTSSQPSAGPQMHCVTYAANGIAFPSPSPSISILPMAAPKERRINTFTTMPEYSHYQLLYFACRVSRVRGNLATRIRVGLPTFCIPRYKTGHSQSMVTVSKCGMSSLCKIL